VRSRHPRQTAPRAPRCGHIRGLRVGRGSDSIHFVVPMYHTARTPSWTADPRQPQRGFAPPAIWQVDSIPLYFVASKSIASHDHLETEREVPVSLTSSTMDLVSSVQSAQAYGGGGAATANPQDPQGPNGAPASQTPGHPSFRRCVAGLSRISPEADH
jgi:hypothetical protein